MFPGGEQSPEVNALQRLTEMAATTPGAMEWLKAVIPGPPGLTSSITRGGLHCRHATSGFSMEVPTLWRAVRIEEDWIQFAPPSGIPWVAVTVHPSAVGDRARRPEDLAEAELANSRKTLAEFEPLGRSDELAFGRTAVPAAAAESQYTVRDSDGNARRMQAIITCVLCQHRAFTVMAETLVARIEQDRPTLHKILWSFSLDVDVEPADIASPADRQLLPYLFGLHADSNLTRAEFNLLNEKIMALPMAAPDGLPLSLGARLRIIRRQASNPNTESPAPQA